MLSYLGSSEPNIWRTTETFGGILQIASGGCSKSKISILVPEKICSSVVSCLLWAPQPWWMATSLWHASAGIWTSCFLHLLPQLCLGHSSWLTLLLEGTHSGPVQECLEKEIMWQHLGTRQRQRCSNSSFQMRFMEEFSSWGSLCSVGHSFVLSWHSPLIPNYWLYKK